MLHLDLKSRRLENSDLPALNDMSRSVGWGYGEIYWKVILASFTGIGVFDQENRLAGCIFVTDYGENRGNIGVLIVSKDHRGKGIASFLMEQAENIVANGAGAVTLIATPDGTPVYTHRGYEVIGECHVLIRDTENASSPLPDLPGYRFTSITEENMPDILALDHISFKANRTHILYSLLKAADKTVALYNRETGELAGFGMLYRRADMKKLGPIVATTMEEAVGIVQMLIYGMSGAVRMDVLSHQPDFIAKAQEFGFKTTDIDPVMVLRGDKSLIDCPQLFAIASQTLG